MAERREGSSEAPLGRSPAARGRRRGFSIAEVMIAMLLTAVIVVSVFSAVLTAKRGLTKSEPKVVAAYSSKLALDRLRNYVAASLEPGMGPNPANGAWTLPGDNCGGCNYALATGVDHDVTDLLPPSLKGPPYNMKVVYTVTNTGPGGSPINHFDPAAQANFRPKIDVRITWDDRE